MKTVTVMEGWGWGGGGVEISFHAFRLMKLILKEESICRKISPY